MNILILSDLHIGEKARCAGLKPRPRVEDQNARLLDHLETFSKKLNCRVDSLIVPGDLTNAAKVSEYHKFDQVAARIQKMFSIPSEKIYFTLGNHDTDWHVQKSLPDGEDADVFFSRRYDNARESSFIKAALERAKGDFWSDHFCIWYDSDILVVSINTSFHERPNDQMRFGLVNDEILANIRVKQHAALNAKYQHKVLIVHHHPYPYKNVLQHWKDHSALQNAELLTDFYEEYNFDILVHGHRHVPDFKSSLGAGGRQITSLCSGSFSVTLDANMNNKVSNQLHLVEFSGRDRSTGVATGRIRSWAFTFDDGWLPSQQRDGIEHVLGFGPNVHRAPLKTKMTRHLAAKLKSSDFVKAEELVASIKELSHVRATFALEILKEICAENGYDLIGSFLNEAVVLSDRRSKA